MPAEPLDFDPSKIDLITPERYEREGYPHDEWTWLRAHAPVFWYERPNFDPFWAITRHADIVEIGKRPDDFLIEPPHRDLREATCRWMINRCATS